MFSVRTRSSTTPSQSDRARHLAAPPPLGETVAELPEVDPRLHSRRRSRFRRRRAEVATDPRSRDEGRSVRPEPEQATPEHRCRRPLPAESIASRPVF
jgi:hypothetical protein